MTHPSPQELLKAPVAELRDRAVRILDRMKQTPYGPKRKRLADQHVELLNQALRNEGWNDALAALQSKPTEDAVQAATGDAELDAGAPNRFDLTKRGFQP